MLRRPLGHHRGLRARGHATVSANRPNDRRQGRHLMTASQSRKSDRRVRCLSIGHGTTPSDILPSPQIVRQFTAFDATRRSSMSPFIVGQLAGSARLRSHTTSAALNSPWSTPRHPRAPSRGFLPWRFADAGPVRAAPPSWRRHPKTFAITDSGTAANGIINHLVSTQQEGLGMVRPTAFALAGRH